MTKSLDEFGFLVKYYYLASPLFMFFDWLTGMSFRISGIESDTYRFGYYVLIIVCGIICWKIPKSASLIGILETSINYLILIVVPFTNYLEAVDQVYQGKEIELFSNTNGINFILNGCILALALNNHIKNLREGG